MQHWWNSLGLSNIPLKPSLFYSPPKCVFQFSSSNSKLLQKFSNLSYCKEIKNLYMDIFLLVFGWYPLLIIGKIRKFSIIKLKLSKHTKKSRNSRAVTHWFFLNNIECQILYLVQVFPVVIGEPLISLSSSISCGVSQRNFCSILAWLAGLCFKFRAKVLLR